MDTMTACGLVIGQISEQHEGEVLEAIEYLINFDGLEELSPRYKQACELYLQHDLVKPKYIN